MLVDLALLRQRQDEDEQRRILQAPEWHVDEQDPAQRREQPLELRVAEGAGAQHLDEVERDRPIDLRYDGEIGGPKMDLVLEAEKLGFESVWSGESYGTDSVSPIVVMSCQASSWLSMTSPRRRPPGRSRIG